MSDKMKLFRKCRHCKEVFTLEVEPQDYNAWVTGTLIQKAMPYLSRGDRELLITGLCGDCFNAVYRDV